MIDGLLDSHNKLNTQFTFFRLNNVRQPGDHVQVGLAWQSEFVLQLFHYRKKAGYQRTV